MKKSRRGITLVELILCCAITAMLAGACTALLVSGQRLFAAGSRGANDGITADLLTSYFYHNLPSMRKASVIPKDEAKVGSSPGTDWVALYLEEDQLTLASQTGCTRLSGVARFEFGFTQVGTNPQTARAQFRYTVTLEDGQSVSGGVVIGNLKYAEILGYDPDAGGDTNTLGNEKALLFTKTIHQ